MKIFTDGSAHPNPGPGGFGVVVVDDDDNLIDCYSKQTENTTNNREEIKAILYSMVIYGFGHDEWTAPTVYSDSNYCVQTFTNWMYGWERNGWVKSDKKVPENLDLIQAYFVLEKAHTSMIHLVKIKGHAGHKWNELADKLATGKITPEEAKRIYG